MNKQTTSAAKTGVAQKRHHARLHMATVEYAMISNLVVQQYQQDHEVLYDKLLAIPSTDRIPALVAQYGKKTVHRLLSSVLKEFVMTMGLPAYKRPTDTRLSVLACEVMLCAEEDHLALEDIILYLQRVKAGYYGSIKTLVQPAILLHGLDTYRKERHKAYVRLRVSREEAHKALGPQERMAPEPVRIGELFSEAVVVNMHKKMSG